MNKLTVETLVTAVYEAERAHYKKFPERPKLVVYVSQDALIELIHSVTGSYECTRPFDREAMRILGYKMFEAGKGHPPFAICHDLLGATI